MSFDSEVKAAADQMMVDAAKFVEKNFSKVCNGIVADTPVITGKLINNWNATIGSPLAVDRSEGKSGQDSVSSYKAVAKEITPKTIGQKFFLTNGVEYANSVEFGGEREPNRQWQNPKGMLRTNIINAGTK
tara:strand:- start:326 stop:718 length:393 start_codon:yes stop_codon:yes gene_type:complete